VRYISTRGEAPILAFDDVLLAGLARDGGLYVPEAWPEFEFLRQVGKPYAELATYVMAPYLGETIRLEDFAAMVVDAYAQFDHAEVAPLRPLGEDEWLLELFHGPTLAFKDFALQLVGRLFDYVLQRRGEGITIVGATSGDTGSAAIAACRDRASMDVFILHPHGRVSEVQRRQMTTETAPNVHNIAIEGSFDDCQAIVKSLFGNARFRNKVRLSAVNSINWARIMAQIVYYASAALRVGERDAPVTFAVPTGNFGNVFAGYAAMRMGLPVQKFVVGSNRNDILTRFFETGKMEVQAVEPSLSPSMDIQVSSNFERLLFDMMDRDAPAVTKLMETFKKTGKFEVPDAVHRKIGRTFKGARLDDERTIAAIREIHDSTGVIVDPHTAVGIIAGRARRGRAKGPLVALATAHPAKFPDAVEQAVGERPGLPEHLADLYDREERSVVLPARVGKVKEYILKHARMAEAA